MVNVVQKLSGNGSVHGVDEGGLLVQDQVGVIGNAAGDREKILKQRKAAVTSTDPNYGVGYISCTIHDIVSFLIVKQFSSYRIHHFGNSDKRYCLSFLLYKSVIE